MPVSKGTPDDAFIRWSHGNKAAAALLHDLAQIARVADDIVDGDQGSEAVSHILVLALCRVAPNPFYREHASVLSAVFGQTIALWAQSDRFHASGDPLKEQFGFVLRHATEQIALHVAALTGGWCAAISMADEIFETCHDGDAETLSDWLKG